jgi:molybdopterin biosynthesis enzyme
MAFKEGLIVIPEGVSELSAGTVVDVQDLRCPGL